MQTIWDWLAEQWTVRFADITLAMGDLKPEMSVSHVDESVIEAGLLWWEQPFSCAPGAPVWVGASEDTWTEIGKIILTAAGVDSAAESEIRSTYLEIVGQSMGSLGQDIGARLSTEVTSDKGSEMAPGKVARHSFKIFADIPGKSVLFYLSVSDSLCQTITAGISKPAAPAAPPREETAVGPVASQAALSPAVGSRTFELLLDVELPVSVSFGRTVLKLQDAMRLITGSLIELNRTISDPVELLVNNCVIARGEVVVIEGNYGMRITEIVSQQERLQQSRRYLLN